MRTRRSPPRNSKIRMKSQIGRVTVADMGANPGRRFLPRHAISARAPPFQSRMCRARAPRSNGGRVQPVDVELVAQIPLEEPQFGLGQRANRPPPRRSAMA